MRPGIGLGVLIGLRLWHLTSKFGDGNYAVLGLSLCCGMSLKLDPGELVRRGISTWDSESLQNLSKVSFLLTQANKAAVALFSLARIIGSV